MGKRKKEIFMKTIELDLMDKMKQITFFNCTNNFNNYFIVLENFSNHNKNFPSIVSTKNRYWYLNSVRHNPYGPARVLDKKNNFGSFCEYYLDGYFYSKKNWRKERLKYL